MKLIDDWRDVLTKAWSVRFIIAAAVLSGAEAILPLFIEDIPRKFFALGIFLLTMAAFVARIKAQGNLSK